LIYWIAVGSNIEPETHIARAARSLRQRLGKGRSSLFYRTTAIGNSSGTLSDQPDYLNGLWAFEYYRGMDAMRKLLKEEEKAAGRIRDPRNKYTDRTLDLDIVGVDRTLFEPEEVISRPFISSPLLELEPSMASVLPLQKKIPYTGDMKEELAFSKEIKTILGSA